MKKMFKITCIFFYFPLQSLMCGTQRCARLPIHQVKLLVKIKLNIGFLHGASLYLDIGEGGYEMSKTKVRIKLQAYEHKSLDTACAKNC